MKKIFALLAVFAALVSCSIKENDEPEMSAGPSALHATFDVESEGIWASVDDSFHLFWTAGDMLSVFPGTTCNLQYRFLGKTGDEAGDFEEVPASGHDSGAGVNATLAVYPYQPAAELSEDGTITLEMPAVQQYAPGAFAPGANTMVAVTGDKSGNSLSFKNLCGYIVVRFYGDMTVKSVTIEGSQGEMLAGKATVTAAHGSAPSLVMAEDATNSITIDCGEGVTLGSTAETATEFWFCIPPVIFNNGFTVTAEGEAGSYRKFVRDCFVIERNLCVSVPARKVGPVVMEAVDLGLPSGLKWASFNVGASEPYESGSYFQWGGLKDVTSFENDLSIGNCIFHTGYDYTGGWTKYIPSDQAHMWSGAGSPDDKTVLDPEDDIAHVMLGDGWRMPTNAEFQELADNCTSEWTNLNGMNGRIFTSKKNGNSIFLPAAGCRYSDCLYACEYNGYYWSSSLNTEIPCHSYYFDFNMDNAFMGYDYRFNGMPVRPVSDKGIIHVESISLSETSIKLTEGDDRTLTANISPANAYNQNVTWTSSNTSVAEVDGSGKVTALATGETTITATSYDGNKKATCIVTVTSAIDAIEAIDLGLPSGLKWGSVNLGSIKPERYGGYYQWGGMEDVTDTSIYLDGGNCPYHEGTDLDKGWTKYVPSNFQSMWSGAGSPDNKTVLDPEDDIVRIKLGGKWRMPTMEEFNELTAYCTSVWTKVNGVNGLKFTSRKNGRSIFLPAAGYRNFGTTTLAGSNGYYWTSTVGTIYPAGAYGLSFYSSGMRTGIDYRFSGMSVRPVSRED